MPILNADVECQGSNKSSMLMLGVNGECGNSARGEDGQMPFPTHRFELKNPASYEVQSHSNSAVVLRFELIFSLFTFSPNVLRTKLQTEIASHSFNTHSMSSGQRELRLPKSRSQVLIPLKLTTENFCLYLNPVVILQAIPSFMRL